MIILKSNTEIEYMKEAGKIVAHAHEAVRNAIKPGITTKELDEIAEKEIRKHGSIPAFKGLYGFPASICASINEEVVHGIPGLKVVKDGDIISVDIGASFKGYNGDSAKTHPVGKVTDKVQKLIDVTKQSFYEGLKFCREGYRLSDISHAIQTYVESNGFSVVRDFVGHGIGQEMHEDPQIPNYGPQGKGPRLKSGMALAIEPMVNMGTFKVKVLEDDWTVVTLDRKPSAHYEHTIVITKDDPIILTSL
ncbi:type I methionyl aminopeptidase [Crassaminicella profunda]|uniref:type I methionyl aminopeptidase n=1 Tax=Crassaminicella profunda TaxID=1286698 RepID=UPI001CA6452A|nr:type I methionyl aminopeptidase [Crassaminicella profunda]QZY54606.1 type I methionyl aminopeptidase [Crassaminicella profunda]